MELLQNSEVEQNQRNRTREFKKLSNDQRRQIFEILLSESKNGKPKYGSLKVVAAQFSVHVKTIAKLWSRAKSSMHLGAADVNSRSFGRVGRKRIQIVPDEVKLIPYCKRKTVRSLAAALKISKSAVHRRFKEGYLKRHSNVIKPSLTEANKKARLEFCISKINPYTLDDNPTFEAMFDCVHIDEKWFFTTKATERYYLLPKEIEPNRTCQSKKFITKVMFMAAVARPRFDTHRNEMFSRKIGMFPFVYKEPAKRNSKNREAGTIETKVLVSVTTDAITKCLIEKVLPAIREKWPQSSFKVLYIQQDNAKPHNFADDPEFLEAANKDGFLIKLSCQPPNSPDLNVLDLGFFHAIQSLQYQESPKTVDDLVEAVEKAFNQLSPKSLNHVFLSLQLVMNEIIQSLGGNNFHLKHIKKNKLEREGRIPVCISCDLENLNQARFHLENNQE